MLEYFYSGSEYIAQELFAKYPSLKQEILSAIAPEGHSFLAEDSMSLLRLALNMGKNIQTLNELKESDPKTYNGLVLHQKSFFWMENNYKRTTQIPIESFFVSLLAESKKDKQTIQEELIALEHYSTTQKAKRDAVYKKVDAESQKSIALVARIAFWQDRRKRAALIGDHYLNLFLSRAAAEVNVPFELLQFTIPSEFVSILEGNKPNVEELRARMKGCVQIADKRGNMWMITGKSCEVLREKLMPALGKSNLQEIKGITVSVGLAKGIARIVKQPTDTFHPGEILVTGMTRPEFVPLMKKAAGIITDEGGMTSHAAIVSRELKIPCIVGTKIATKVIENG